MKKRPQRVTFAEIPYQMRDFTPLRLPFAVHNGYSLKKKEQMVQKTYYKTKDYCKVKFSFKVENAETIEILGLNSDWENAVLMSKKKDGTFSADINLPKESKHEFRYLVNETEWLNEPGADAQEPNVFGSTNSVIIL